MYNIYVIEYGSVQQGGLHRDFVSARDEREAIQKFNEHHPEEKNKQKFLANIHVADY